MYSMSGAGPSGAKRARQDSPTVVISDDDEELPDVPLLPRAAVAPQPRGNAAVAVPFGGTRANGNVMAVAPQSSRITISSITHINRYAAVPALQQGNRNAAVPALQQGNRNAAPLAAGGGDAARFKDRSGRWWCDDCRSEAGGGCARAHSLLDTAAARAALEARVAAARAALQAATDGLRNAQATLDYFQGALYDRGDVVHVSCRSGWRDGDDIGDDFAMPLATVAPLSAQDRQRVRALLRSARLAVRRPSDKFFQCYWPLPPDLQQRFTKLSQRDVLKEGALLFAKDKLLLRLERCGPGGKVAGHRLVGFVSSALVAGLAEVATKCKCDRYCRSYCVFCVDGCMTLRMDSVEFMDE